MEKKWENLFLLEKISNGVIYLRASKFREAFKNGFIWDK